MPQVSKYPVSGEVYERIINLLFETISGLQTKKAVSDFFEEFLTPTEHIMLAKRLAIGLLLAKEYQYRDISKILNVSLSTIGSVAVNYKYGKAFRMTINKIVNNEKMADFWLRVAETISAGGTIGKGSGGWRYLNVEAKKKRNKPF